MVRYPPTVTAPNSKVGFCNYPITARGLKINSYISNNKLLIYIIFINIIYQMTHKSLKYYRKK